MGTPTVPCPSMPSCTGSFVCSFTPVLRHAMLPTCHGIWHGYNCMPMGRHARPGPPLTQAQPCCLRHRAQPHMDTTIRGGQTCHQKSHRVSAYPSLLTAEERSQPSPNRAVGWKGTGGTFCSHFPFSCSPTSLLERSSAENNLNVLVANS